MNFDNLIEMIGEFGSYQKRVLFCLYLDSIMDAFHSGLTMFILPQLNFRCSLPGFKNDTYKIQGRHHEWIINQSIPVSTVNGDTAYNSCTRFYVWNDTNVTLEKCNSWVFDKSVYKATLIEEFSLVCDQKMMNSHIVTVFYLGVLAGAALMGTISDWVGRKIVMIVCILLQGIVGIASAFSQNINQFLICRFIIGFASSGSFVTAYVLGAELVGTKKRAWTCMVTQIFFTIGFCILTGVAYFVRNWRILLIILSAPSIILSFSLVWCVQESPRLLFMKNKNEKAFKIVKLIAEKNKKSLPENIDEMNIDVQQAKSHGIWKVWTSKTLILRNSIMSINWVSVSLCYFALAINSRNLSGDVYLKFILGALVEFPAYVVTIYLLDHNFGRRIIFSTSMVVAGSACFISTFPFVYGGPDLQWVTLMFCLVGRLAVTAAFGIIYLFVCEIYPTVARNGALGIFSTFNRIGSITAPYIMILGDYVKGNFGKGLPFILLAFFTLVSGPLVLLLPESAGRCIPDTLKEAKMMKRSETRKKYETRCSAEDIAMKCIKS